MKNLRAASLVGQKGEKVELSSNLVKETLLRCFSRKAYGFVAVRGTPSRAQRWANTQK